MEIYDSYEFNDESKSVQSANTRSTGKQERVTTILSSWPMHPTLYACPG